MFCPFLIGDHPKYCGAGRTTYTPEEQESRLSCMNMIAENYRDCWRYRRMVWSGLAPTRLERKIDAE